jgi:hypothetical protein
MNFVRRRKEKETIKNDCSLLGKVYIYIYITSKIINSKSKVILRI